MNERREVRELDVGMNDENANHENRDCAELDVGREIVARLQHQPDGKNRCDQSVDGHQNRDLVRSEGKR